MYFFVKNVNQLVGITIVKAMRSLGLTESLGGDTKGKKQESDKKSTGKRLFITGGAGGVGTLAVQLAKKVYGFDFVATTAVTSPLCARFFNIFFSLSASLCLVGQQLFILFDGFDVFFDCFDLSAVSGEDATVQTAWFRPNN
jgi:NADPH:quinone reductase-like Zn-dependent oxidoreductase